MTQEENNKYTDLKLWNKKRLILRIVTFPIKLAFQVLWGVLSSILYSLKWLKNGSQEVVYGDDFEKSIVRLIQQNEEIIVKMNSKKTLSQKL